MSLVLLPSFLAIALLGQAPAVAPVSAPLALPSGFEGATELPTDAALLVSLRLPEIEDGFAFLDLLTGLYPNLGQQLTALREPLGVQIVGPTELATHGIATDTPVLLSLHHLDPLLWKTREGPLATHRIVVRINDEVKFIAFARDVFKRMGYEVALIDPNGHEQPGARWWKPFRIAGFKQAIRIGGLSKDGQAAVVRIVNSEHAVIEFAVAVVTPVTGKASAKAGLRALKALTTIPKVPRPMLAQTIHEGIHKQLSSSGSLSVVVEANRIAGLIPEAACRERYTPATGAFFQSAAIVARLQPFDWRLRAQAAFTPEGRAAFGESGSNDGLVDTREFARAGLGAVALYTPSAGAIQSVVRPAFLKGGVEEAMGDADACGGWALTLMAVRHWPHLFGSWLQIVTQKLGAATLQTQARNLAVGWKRDTSSATLTFVSTTLFSIGAEHEPTLTGALLPMADGEPEKAAFGNRSPRLFTLLPTAPFGQVGIEPLPGANIGVSLADGNNGLGWYYSQKQRPAVFGNRVAIGALHLNVGRLLQMQAESADVSTQDAVRLAASQIGLMGGELSIIDGLLNFDLRLQADDVSLGL
jgi:hypothetical protein